MKYYPSYCYNSVVDFTFQKLLEIQEEYNLEKIEEKGLDIETENFDPAKSHVNLTLRSTELESGLWVPNQLPCLLWNSETKTFFKVSFMTKSIG